MIKMYSQQHQKAVTGNSVHAIQNLKQFPCFHQHLEHPQLNGSCSVQGIMQAFHPQLLEGAALGNELTCEQPRWQKCAGKCHHEFVEGFEDDFFNRQISPILTSPQCCVFSSLGFGVPSCSFATAFLTFRAIQFCESVLLNYAKTNTSRTVSMLGNCTSVTINWNS